MKRFLITLLTLLALLIPLIVEKVLAFFFFSLNLHKQSTNKNFSVYNFSIKENANIISFLQELNFLRYFYTPA
ncbi:MAG: hypothetical protein LBM71_00295 [Elusimicrobiota bacterium]|nr:hypothetical protein [Elusimicrobiota bacterium]